MRKYRTIQGDTWDKVAYRKYREYGGEKLISVLINANSEYADYVVFPAGIILDLPDIEVPVASTLPPWYRE